MYNMQMIKCLGFTKTYQSPIQCLISYFILPSSCSQSDDKERAAAAQAEDAAHDVDHNQYDVGEQVGDWVAAAVWYTTRTLPPHIVVPKHPVAAEDDPHE